MNKLLIPVGLALGLVGGTAWAVATMDPPPAVHADSLAMADSLPPADSAAADSVASHGSDEGHATPRVGPTPVATAAPSVPTTVPARRTRAAGVDDGAAAEDEGAEQLARIFAVMQPRDAARVLSHLKDVEIQAILTRMGARQAASVLSNMEPDRAAVLSRAVLDGVGP